MGFPGSMSHAKGPGSSFGHGPPLSHPPGPCHPAFRHPANPRLLPHNKHCPVSTPAPTHPGLQYHTQQSLVFNIEQHDTDVMQPSKMSLCQDGNDIVLNMFNCS
ncbi:UNVERIFIED_CONTAM: hypothetical protein FKN15_001191 [Acipenser sinensis]